MLNEFKNENVDTGEGVKRSRKNCSYHMHMPPLYSKSKSKSPLIAPYVLTLAIIPEDSETTSGHLPLFSRVPVRPESGGRNVNPHTTSGKPRCINSYFGCLRSNNISANFLSSGMIMLPRVELEEYSVADEGHVGLDPGGRARAGPERCHGRRDRRTVGFEFDFSN